MKLHRYIKIPINGSARAMDPEATGLEQLQEAVGGYIEAVYTTNHHILLVNDNRWTNALDINPLGSALANRPIYGDAVLTGLPTPEGEDGEIEPQVAEMVLGIPTT